MRRANSRESCRFHRVVVERMHHPSVHIDADVQFDAVPSASLSCDTDVVPGAALMCTESGAVNRDGHLLFTEEPGDQVHRFQNVFNGEAGHASMDDAVPWKPGAIGGDAVAVFHVGFDTIVGLIQTYFQEASDCDGSGGRVLYILFFSTAKGAAVDILL